MTSIHIYFNFRLSLAELVDILDDEEDTAETDIYILPPENEYDTEADSDYSDDEHIGNINHLPRGILSKPCEIVSMETNSNDDSDPEDILPLADLRKRLIQNKGNENIPTATYVKSKWIVAPADKPNNNICTSCKPKDVSTEAEQASTPSEFLRLFFDQELFQIIILESNRYASQKNIDLNLTIEELHVFFGILLLSGYGKYPNRRCYWLGEDDVPKLVQDSMRLKRFEKILKYIHFNDNNNIIKQDRLYKLRPLIDQLNQKFRKHGGLDENLSIDESMVPYYGKHYAKQYIRGKPIRFGYKNWALCSSSGYMYGFQIYTGKDSSNEKQFGLGGDVVVSLLKQVEVPPNHGHKLYFDNYFTSLRLLSHLANKKYCATGTMRENRLEQCPVSNKKIWNKAQRGTYNYFKNDNSLLVQWKDNKVVSMASNFEGIDIVNASRWDRVSKSKKNIPQPKMISSYNKGMGGVDKLDSLVAVYRTRIRQRKWYWPLVAYLLDVSVVNGWILMKKVKPSAPGAESLLQFRRYISLNFLKTFGVKPQQGRVTRPIEDVKYDNLGHLIVYNETDRRCGLCGKKSQFICEKCKIGLHPKICFKLYHSK